MDTKKLNILFLSSWYPTKRNPLLGIFVKNHAAAIAKYHDVTVVYVTSDKEDRIEETTEDGIYTIRVYYKKVGIQIPILSTYVSSIRYVRAWKKAVEMYQKKKGKPDIIHANVVYPVSYIAARLKRMWNVPYIITEHWSGYLPEDGRYNNTLVKYVSRKGVKDASAITVVSQDLKSWMQKAGLNNNYHVISNVVDINAFAVGAKKQRALGECNFIHVASFDATEKNSLAILRAFTKVNKDFPKATLTLKGEGWNSPEVLKLCEPVKGNISIVNADAPEPLSSLLQRMDVSVLFSDFETQSVVLLESLCCGIPVISSNVRAVTEYVNSKNGILVERKNEEQLYQAMSSIIGKLDEYNPAEIRESVVKMVSPDTVAAQFQEVYNQVLKNK